MAHVILGLLMLWPQSLYDLVKNFEAGVSLVYSASSGSIRRALETLLTRGLIEVHEVGPGARGRKTYRVTDAGRAEFRRWMTAPLTGADVETAALSRLYFLGLLDPEERQPVLAHIAARIEADLDRLTALDERLETVEIPAGYEDVAASQRATLDYGLASQRFALEWFRDLADRYAVGD